MQDAEFYKETVEYLPKGNKSKNSYSSLVLSVIRFLWEVCKDQHCFEVRVCTSKFFFGFWEAVMFKLLQNPIFKSFLILH